MTFFEIELAARFQKTLDSMFCHDKGLACESGYTFFCHHLFLCNTVVLDLWTRFLFALLTFGIIFNIEIRSIFTMFQALWRCERIRFFRFVYILYLFMYYIICIESISLSGFITRGMLHHCVCVFCRGLGSRSNYRLSVHTFTLPSGITTSRLKMEPITLQ